MFLHINYISTYKDSDFYCDFAEKDAKTSDL